MFDSCLAVGDSWLSNVPSCWMFECLPNVPRLTLHTNHSLPHPYLRQGHRNVRFHLWSKKYLYPELWLCHFLHGFYILAVQCVLLFSAFAWREILGESAIRWSYWILLVLLFPEVWSHGLKPSHGSFPVARHTDSWRQAFYVHHPDAQARFGHNHVEYICLFVCF